MKIAKRLGLFVLVGLLTFGLGLWLAPVKNPWVLVFQQSPWKVLLAFENQDLQKLDLPSTRMVEGAVKAITERDENTVSRLKPALFQSMPNTAGEKRYLLVEIAPMVIIPGNTSLRVHVFDTTGRVLNVQKFNAGYRSTVTGIHIRDNAILQRPLLVVDVEYVFGGNPSTQYYALVGDDLSLIYLEQNGKLDKNNYDDSYMTIGPEDERLADEAEKDLDSSNEAEVLSALVWLNGYHSELPLKSRAGLQKRLKELRQSENIWISSAAQSVLESKY